MGIDVTVSPLRAALRGLRRAHRPFYFSADHLRRVGEPFEYRDWRKRLMATPEFDLEDEDLTWFERLKPSMKALSEEQVRDGVRALQRGLSGRLGLDVAWDDDAYDGTDFGTDGEYVGRLDPRGMLYLHLLAGQYALGKADTGNLLRALEGNTDPSAHERWSESEQALWDHMPQLGVVDIENMLLPTPFDAPLHGLPYRIGSAPTLQDELQGVARHLKLSIVSGGDEVEVEAPDDSDVLSRVGYNLGILLTATRLAAERGVPVFIDG